MASTGAPLRSEVVYRAARELCISRDSTSNGPESERSNAAREVTEDGHHRWGGACNTKQNRSGCGDSRPSTAAASRPVSSRSARSEEAVLIGWYERRRRWARRNTIGGSSEDSINIIPRRRVRFLSCTSFHHTSDSAPVHD